MRAVHCPDCNRTHYYQAHPAPPLPTWRDTLRQSMKLIVGTAFVYAFAVVYFAGAVR